jgi:hypothetical protein
MDEPKKPCERCGKIHDKPMDAMEITELAMKFVEQIHQQTHGPAEAMLVAGAIQTYMNTVHNLSMNQKISGIMDSLDKQIMTAIKEGKIHAIKLDSPSEIRSIFDIIAKGGSDKIPK